MKKYLYLFFLLAMAVLGFTIGTNESRLGGLVAVSLITVYFTPKLASKANGLTEVGTVASGIGTPTSFDLTFLPQYLYFIQTASCDVRIQIAGPGVVYDMPAAGVAELGIARVIGRFTNGFQLQIANGLVLGKTVRITVTNQVASAFTLYYGSEVKGDVALKGEQIQVVAPANVEFEDFYTLAFPGSAAADLFTFTMEDGLQQQYRREGLRGRLGRTQNVINTTGYTIDNYDQRIASVLLNTATTQTVYRLGVQEL